MIPGDSGSISTSKPGLGVAHRTSTPEAENETAAVPPVSENVRVVAAVVGAAVEVGAVVRVGAVEEGAVVEEEAVVDVEAVVGGDVVLGFDTEADAGGAVGRVEDELLESSTVACVVEDDADSARNDVFDSEPGTDDPPVVVSTPATRNPTSSAAGGAMIWLSTTDTPAHATPTAPALAANHIMNNTTLLIQSLSPFVLHRHLNTTLNEP